MMVVWCIFVFYVAATYDAANAQYVRAAALGKPIQAAGWSAIVALLGLCSLFSVFRVSIWLAIPEVLGLIVGTYIGVLYTKDRD